MSTNPEQKTIQQSLDLKDPALAGFLAWLVPGLGHLYQGRRAKAALFFICIMGTFVYGCYLGGSEELGWGRVVYFSWRPGEKRLPYLCQVGIGLPAMPALVQAVRMNRQQRVFCGGLMAPPVPAEPQPHGDPSKPADPNGPNADQPTTHTLHYELHRFWELGTVYTMIAGLLNVLVIFDALGGPVFAETAKKEEKEEKKRAKRAEAEDDEELDADLKGV